MRDKANKFRLAVCFLAVLSYGSVDAQMPDPNETVRSMAETKLMLGESYMQGKNYSDAAMEFESVWDLGDNQSIADLRAQAGVFLCIARAYNEQTAAAKDACKNVLQMPNAPQEIKKAAAKMLDKLN